MRQDLDHPGIRHRPDEPPPDLVFDFESLGSPDLGALCLVLTARGLATADRRRVWLRALPEPTWRLLHVMGLEDLFELLPRTGGPTH